MDVNRRRNKDKNKKRIEKKNNMFGTSQKGEELLHSFYVWLQKKNGMSYCNRCKITKLPSIKMKKKTHIQRNKIEAQRCIMGVFTVAIVFFPQRDFNLALVSSMKSFSGQLSVMYKKVNSSFALLQFLFGLLQKFDFWSILGLKKSCCFVLYVTPFIKSSYKLIYRMVKNVAKLRCVPKVKDKDT